MCEVIETCQPVDGAGHGCVSAWEAARCCSSFPGLARGGGGAELFLREFRAGLGDTGSQRLGWAAVRVVLAADRAGLAAPLRKPSLFQP